MPKTEKRPGPFSFGRSPKSGRWKNFLSACLGILLIGGFVQAAGIIKGDSLVFPGVPQILSAFFRLIRSAETWEKIGVTLIHLSEAVLISTVIGVSLGLVQGMNPFFRNLLTPLMVFLRSIPMIVLSVIVMVITKYENVPVAVPCLVLIPMISEAASEGCRRIEPELIDVYRLNGSFGLRILLRVYLPLMAGYLRQAWLNAVGVGVRTAVTAEYLVQNRNSLGKAIFTSSYFFEYEDIFAYALIMILLILLISELPLNLLKLLRKDK